MISDGTPSLLGSPDPRISNFVLSFSPTITRITPTKNIIFFYFKKTKTLRNKYLREQPPREIHSKRYSFAIAFANLSLDSAWEAVQGGILPLYSEYIVGFHQYSLRFIKFSGELSVLSDLRDSQSLTNSLVTPIVRG